MKQFRWRGASGGGLEHLVFARNETMMTARSVVISDEGFACQYALDLDNDWRVCRVCVALIGSERPCELSRDGAGTWIVNGRTRPDLAEAIDADITVTPFTNTLPIRRLAMEVGHSHDIVTAYIALPSFDVFPDPQRYTRLSESTYLFESRDTDFRRELTVDADGFVTEYAGLFTRETDTSAGDEHS
ncbi:MAG: putative glycolipid-binding domain-containing protein [Akkermansiaceae bacterium]|nr:putative glycolipid-binding domain-containing protein [Armatimonadota bacterium]